VGVAGRRSSSLRWIRRSRRSTSGPEVVLDGLDLGVDAAVELVARGDEHDRDAAETTAAVTSSIAATGRTIRRLYERPQNGQRGSAE
jgi:hypothetical protein